MEAIIYARQSKDDSGEEKGVRRQTEDGEKLAELRGYNVIARYADNDVTGTGKKKRPGFESVIKDITSGRAQVVIIWEMARIQRNRADEVRLYEACKNANAKIAMVRGPELDFSTPSGRLVADVLGSVARQEIEMKADRQQRAQEQAAYEGRRVGGRRPMGYTASGMELIKEEADAVRTAYDAFLAGTSLGSIARSWNTAGLISPQGSEWDRGNVGQVLRNARNAGKRTYRGAIVADAAWPEIVPETTWRAVRTILDDPSRRTAPRGGTALLTGIAVCGVCGTERVHTGGTPKHVEYATYRCRSMRCVSRNAGPVDKFVSDVIVERLSRPDAAELLIDAEAPDLDAVNAELLALRSRQTSLAVDFADGILTGQQLRAASERIAGRITELESKIADAGRVDILGPLVHAEDVQAVWDGMDTDRRRAVIAVLADVTIYAVGRGTRTFRPETVRVEFRGVRRPALPAAV